MTRLLRSFALIASLLAIAGCAQADNGDTALAYTLLDDSGSPLREDFNRAKGSVRLLFVVDPACPTCLRGLADLNDALLAGTQDPRLQTFVVHVPVIGGTAQDIPPAAGLLQNPNVRHYWNASGEFGRRLAPAVGLKRGDAFVYPWDVWMVYGPEAVWDASSPPKPHRLMHQLPSVSGFAYLDSKVFAQDAQGLLAQLPKT
ncbi:MAG: hypothetical protein ACREMA_18450 [Longimicrobiales bacterium]